MTGFEPIRTYLGVGGFSRLKIYDQMFGAAFQLVEASGKR